MAINVIITDVGISAINNAEQAGTAKVWLKNIGLGANYYPASKTNLAMGSRFKTITAGFGGKINGNSMQITMTDDSDDEYDLHEIGIYTESGTLFALYSQETPIISKTKSSVAMLAFNFFLSNVNPEYIELSPPVFDVSETATETREGVAEIATVAEAKAGTDDTRFITPKKLDAVIEGHDNIVHKKGAEAITGYKCFEGPIGKRDVTGDVSVIPAGNKYSSFDFSDKNNVKYASVVGAIYSTDEVGAILATNRTINGTEYHSQISVRLDKNGTPYATAPTPANGDNSTKIATTAWVTTKAKEYLPLSGGTLIGSLYFSQSGNIKSATTDYIMIMSGENHIDSPHILLRGADATQTETEIPGEFFVIANNGTNVARMVGRPDGSLTWNGKNIVRSVNNVNADAAGNVTIGISDIQGLKDAIEGGLNVVLDYLPLAGGQMTSTTAISRNVANSFLGLHGGTGTNNDGAQLFLCGASHSTMPGAFQLTARNSSIAMTLQGNLDGTLNWGDKYVLNNSFTLPTDTGAIHLTAGTSATGGAYFRLYGKDHSTGKGQFSLTATDGTTTNTKALTGKPDGSLTWGGKDVVCVKSWKSSDGSSWYRKYSDGWIEQGGVGKSDGDTIQTLPVPFTNSVYAVFVTPQNYGYGQSYGTKDRTTTGFKIVEGWNCEGDQVESNNGYDVFWHACGY